MKRIMLIELVQVVFQPLLQEYGLKALALANDEVLVYSASVKFWIYAQRDGIYIGCIRSGPDGHYLDYSLAPMALKWRAAQRGEIRPSVEEPFEAKIRCELEFYARFLKESGNDILQGDESWVREYPGNPLKLSLRTEEKIKANQP